MKKKILIIQQNLQGGGAEKVLCDILQNFDYDIFDVTLLLIYRKGVYLESLPKNVKMAALFGEKLPIVARVLILLKLYRFLHLYYNFYINFFLKNREFDTTISFMEGITTLFHSFIFKKSKKNISWVHTDLEHNNWCKSDFISVYHQKKVYQMMDEIIFVSKDAQNAYSNIFGANRGKIIYNIIDRNAIRCKADEYSIPHSKFTVINVGRLIPVKQQSLIIEIAEKIKRNGLDIEFWILGDGELKDVLKQEIKFRKLDDCVKMFGFIPNPYPYIKAADIFLLTSLTEGFSLVVCESLCLGKSVISTNITGPAEILSDGSGILCQPNPDEIIQQIEKLYSNPSLIDELREKALERSKIFDVENTMAQIYSVL